MQTVALLVRLDMRGIDVKHVKVGSTSVMVSPMEKSIQQLVKVHHVEVRILILRMHISKKSLTLFNKFSL